MVVAFFKHPNIERDAEIVIRVAATGVGDYLAPGAASLRIENVLLLIAAQP